MNGEAHPPQKCVFRGIEAHVRVWESPLSPWPADARLGRHSRPFSYLWGAEDMPDMTADDLKEHLKLIRAATTEDLDELLHDLLVRVYPSKKTQDS